ncbi:MAG: S8 family peptidase [Salibacteraceae bacterium]|nr:S8 family peptidase [Salibacteraceae bacterium]
MLIDTKIQLYSLKSVLKTKYFFLKSIILTLAIILSVAFSASAQFISTENFVQGNVMVLLKSEIEASQFCAELNNQTDASFIPSRRLSQSINLWLLEFDPNKLETRKGLTAVERSTSTIIAQLNHTDLNLRTVPDDTLFFKQWAFENNGTNGGSGTADIDAASAWNVTTGGLTTEGDTIVVAVIDGGFYIQHEDLVKNIFINHHEIPQNGIDDDLNGYVDDINGWDSYSNDYTIPIDNHGTHVAGTIGAVGNNEIGVTGVNWNVKILPVAGSSSLESTVIASYGYVLDMRRRYNQTNGAEGAYVVATNSSFGVDYGLPADYPLWCAMYDSLGYAGVLSAGATANLPIDVDQASDVPTACASDFLISVTNTTSSDVRNSGAAFGLETIDIGAPGSVIYSLNNYDYYGNNTGTSMATPHVAGAIGLMYSAACNKYFDESLYTNAELALLMKHKLLTKGVDSLFALSSQVSSGGRLNLYKAVLSVSDSCLAVSGEATIATCDTCNGAIDLTTYGMPSGVEYVWSTGDTSQNINGLCAGVYTVTATQNQEQVILTFTVSELGGPVVTSQIGVISCFDENNGSIVLSGSSDYYWQDGNTDNSRFDLAAGNYFITATDSASGCATLLEIDLQNPPLLGTVVTSQIPVPDTGSNGSFQISPVGGTSPYSIVWSDGSNAFERTDLGSGLYSFIITDANGCAYQDSVYLGIPSSVNEIVNELNVGVFPNPSSSVFNIRSNQKLTELSVYDVNSRLVAYHKLAGYHFALDATSFESGVYFIKIKSASGDDWLKIVKSNE